METNRTEFYQHLLSDSSLEFFPTNVISEFTTRLPHDVTLLGQWQVALCNISYHKTWGNISTRDEGACSLQLWQRTEGPKGVLEPRIKALGVMEPGAYNTPQALIDGIYETFEILKRWDSDPSAKKQYFSLRDILEISHDEHTS
jgi:hypothetical protein